MSNVSKPAHYSAGSIEVIDAIHDWGLGFLRGSAVKYIARAGKKTADPIEDLEKARECLRMEIEYLRAQNAGS